MAGMRCSKQTRGVATIEFPWLWGRFCSVLAWLASALLLIGCVAVIVLKAGAAFSTDVQRDDDSGSTRAQALMRERFPDRIESEQFNEMLVLHSDTLTVDDFPQIKVEVDGVDLEQYAAGAAGSAASEPMPPEVPQAPEPANRALSGRFGVVRALDDGGNVRTLADVELEMIVLAIEHYKGQMSEVARRLGIGRSTLYRKLREYGLEEKAVAEG